MPPFLPRFACAARGTTPPVGSPKRLLIVEDERIVALDLRGALEDLGYVVVGMVASSSDALRAAAEQRPDLVLMDIRIGGPIDGIETARVLRRQYQLPVVYLTANADAATLERALETEPVGYLVKPYNEFSLHATIEVALRRHQAELALWQAHDVENARLQQQTAETDMLVEQLSREATIDPLTELYNRRHLEHVMKREMSFAQRESHSVGVILLDLDRFKRLNDTFGHAVGDSALRAVAAYLRSRIRIYDVACRYGGEEIAIVLPGAQALPAIALAEQLRAGIERLVVTHNGAPVAQITASFGVSSFPRDGIEPDAVLHAADTAMYRAKTEGRNRVVGSCDPAVAGATVHVS